MSNNVVIRGFNALSKVIGRGFSRRSLTGIKVCMRISDEPFVCMELKTSPFTYMKVSVE